MYAAIRPILTTYSLLGIKRTIKGKKKYLQVESTFHSETPIALTTKCLMKIKVKFKKKKSPPPRPFKEAPHLIETYICKLMQSLIRKDKACLFPSLSLFPLSREC